MVSPFLYYCVGFCGNTLVFSLLCHRNDTLFLGILPSGRTHSSFLCSFLLYSVYDVYAVFVFPVSIFDRDTFTRRLESNSAGVRRFWPRLGRFYRLPSKLWDRNLSVWLPLYWDSNLSHGLRYRQTSTTRYRSYYQTDPAVCGVGGGCGWGGVAGGVCVAGCVGTLCDDSKMVGQCVCGGDYCGGVRAAEELAGGVNGPVFVSEEVRL